jgi:TonB-dependent SusC/RagA subfamily outer membrane receptor
MHTQVVGTTNAGKTESVILPWAIDDIKNGRGLILIDGIETKAEHLANVDPRMVKSISILSGPDASIYGSKAANGVIMITLIGK